jgi:tRNA pseudouridine55 synthase
VSRRRDPGADIDGLLLLDKPVGLSSNQALQHARRALGARKAGHTGTLDVQASGLLALCFGQATRLCGWLLDARKRYTAELALGVSTTTGDVEGEVLESVDVPPLSRIDIEQACRGFLGESTQVPPMYSALKSEGRPLYELAREGVEVEREARTIHVHHLEVLAVGERGFTIDVECSKGTYVRTLVEDIGRALGLPAHMAALRRTAVGSHRIEQALTPEALMQACEGGEARALVLPADAVVIDLPALHLGVGDTDRVLHGQPARETADGAPGALRLYGADAAFLGVGERLADGSVWPRRLFSTAGAAGAD